jgi:hypothetical protein
MVIPMPSTMEHVSAATKSHHEEEEGSEDQQRD